MGSHLRRYGCYNEILVKERPGRLSRQPWSCRGHPWSYLLVVIRIGIKTEEEVSAEERRKGKGNQGIYSTYENEKQGKGKQKKLVSFCSCIPPLQHVTCELVR